jgi:hypothetical protein
MQSNEALYAKISKLLALANNTAATEAEAALASEHVQRLLQEHNLTLAQVEVNAPSDNKREKTITERSAAYEWQSRLMAALAANGFCLHQVKQQFVPDRGWGAETKLLDGTWVTGHREKRHLLVGCPLNIRVAVETYDYLIGAMRRAAEDDGFVWSKRTRELNWFLDGAVTRLVERLSERRRAAEAASAATQAPTGNGTHRELVLSDVYGSEADLNNDTLNNYPPGTTAARRRIRAEEEARRAAVQEELVAAGVDRTEALYRSYGYSEEKAKAFVAESNKPSRRGRGGRGRSQNWTQGDRDYARKINSRAYNSGKSAGSSIGLDGQVGGSSGTKRIGR